MSRLVAGMSVLIGLQLVGETIAFLTAVPVPGPVIGMVLLLLFLLLRARVPEGVQTCSEGLIGHLSLMFVPAGVGIIAQLDLVGQRWPLLLAVVTIGTWTTIAVTAWAMAWLMPPDGDPGQPQ